MPGYGWEVHGKVGGALHVLLCAGVLLIAAGNGQAATQTKLWQVTPAESAISFAYRSNGQPDRGAFTRFSGSGRFDPRAPRYATLELHIASASIDLGDPGTSAFATSAEWFDAANHPEIIYRLIDLTPESGDSYLAHGTLTIRGRTHPLSTPIRLQIDGAAAHAAGTLKIDRKDYGLGVGPMSLFVTVGREVDVTFDLTAHPLSP
jgi:polyisoprenoid-binding protein YceI